RLPCGDDADDAGMIELGGDLGLAPEPRQKLLIRRQPGGEHLESDAPARPLLLRLVDLAHAALAQQADDLEFTETVMGLEHGSSSRGLCCRKKEFIYPQGGEQELFCGGWPQL